MCTYIQLPVYVVYSLLRYMYLLLRTFMCQIIPLPPDPDQYMMAMNEFLPDDDAMMNMAIQLSLQQNEVHTITHAIY